MKAIIINKYGSNDVLELVNDYPEPVLYDNQVLIKVHSIGLNPLDIAIRRGKLKFIIGSKFPTILGNDASGTIVKCGKYVKKFKEGDSIYCMVDANKHFSANGFAKSGTYAEYAVTREDTISLKPNSLSYDEAASLPLSSLTAYQALVYKANINHGDKILINGASGGVGVYAIQIAKYFGAIVYAVCSNQNADFVKNLGADVVIDYKSNNINQLTEKFNIVYDVALTTSYSQCKNLLIKNGIFISNMANPLNVLLYPMLKDFSYNKKNQFAWVKPIGYDLSKISILVEQGKLRPVIDKSYTLSEIRNAHEYIESGRVKGKLVVRL